MVNGECDISIKVLYAYRKYKYSWIV